jgi:C-terminal processing protease CtpA/Prc
MFFEINDTKITVNNYMDLIGLDEFKLTLGELNDDFTITPISPQINLKAEVLTIDPILLDTILDHAGEKIGYLVYNSFVADYDDELESVFGKFKSENVSGLVLDLRYNSGGSVNTAVLMASMIAPAADTGKVLLNNSFNDNLTEYFKEKYPDDESIFVDKIRSTPNNLNLTKYVALTTFKTASASEMVIYTLIPYMEVVQLGEQTHGKYYASITLSDPQEKHNWAIQPIVMRAENVNNSIDYSQGLIPKVELNERYKYELGDKREKFLAQALFELTGVWPEGSVPERLKTEERPFINYEYIEESKTPNLKYIMHRETKVPFAK